MTENPFRRSIIGDLYRGSDNKQGSTNPDWTRSKARRTWPVRRANEAVQRRSRAVPLNFRSFDGHTSNFTRIKSVAAVTLFLATTRGRTGLSGILSFALCLSLLAFLATSFLYLFIFPASPDIFHFVTYFSSSFSFLFFFSRAERNIREIFLIHDDELVYFLPSVFFSRGLFCISIYSYLFIYSV